MYIYDRQNSARKISLNGNGLLSQSVHRVLPFHPAPVIDRTGIRGLGRDVSLVDIDHVLRMNRQFAESLGWQQYRDRIVRVLGIPNAADETDFAEAVAHWQRKNRIPRTGIINHETWFHLEIALGLLAPPFPRAALDASHLTDLLFHTRHPERHLAPVQAGETALKAEWGQLRDGLVVPILKQAPMCEASGPEFEQLADYLRWFNAELKKPKQDAKRLPHLANLIRLLVQTITRSLPAYVTSGCSEPQLETMRLLLRALPWPNNATIQTLRTQLLESIQRAQLNALQSADIQRKTCVGTANIRIEVRKPKDFSQSFTKSPQQASLASAAVQIFVPKTTTEVVQLERVHGVLEWSCLQATPQQAQAGGERDIHRVSWAVTQGAGGMCPLNLVGTERLACDGHIYGLSVKPGSTLVAAAEKKGFNMNTCEWKFTETFRATTSAYNGLVPLARCSWGFQFIAEQTIAANGQKQKVASVKYVGVDKEIIAP